MKKQRYCLKRDEDSHWYLIPIDMAETFTSLCEKAYLDDDFDEFNKLFERRRIDGPHRLSFSEPIEDLK